MKRKCHVRELVAHHPRANGLVFKRKMALLRKLVQELFGVYRGFAVCNTARAEARGSGV